MKVYELPDGYFAVTRGGVLVMTSFDRKSKPALGFVHTKKEMEFPQEQYLDSIGSPYRPDFYSEYAWSWVTDEVERMWPIPVKEMK